MTWLLFVQVGVTAGHGGVATLQIGGERINPGGTVDVRGDMTTEGPVEISIVAEGDVEGRALATIDADAEGQFQAFLIVPVDLPAGAYAVRAQSTAEQASAPIEIAGAAVGGEEGQLPGQDEALAGHPPAVDPSSAAALGVPDPVATSRPFVPSSPDEHINLPIVTLVTLASAAIALGLGAALRTRATSTRAPRR